MKITRFWIEPSLTHLNASTAPTIKMAQATPPTNTCLFQGERSAKNDHTGGKMKNPMKNSGL
jgi:hypothetical protein